MKSKKAALNMLALENGFTKEMGTKADVTRFLEREVFDSIVSGICTNKGCEFMVIEGMEPDAPAFECEVCGTYTVVTSLSLADLI